MTRGHWWLVYAIGFVAAWATALPSLLWGLLGIPVMVLGLWGLWPWRRGK